MVLAIGMIVCNGGWSEGESGLPTCHNYARLSQALQEWQKQHSDFMQLSSLAESREGRSVWVMEVGQGKTEERLRRPAILIVGGVEGDRLAGTEAAMAFLDRLSNATEEVQALFDKVTFYVIPRLNPDAAERYFQAPRVEQIGNSTPFDADRDGLIDEDGPEDLNGDGLIAWLRVEDAEGTMIPHPDEGRIVIEADAAKGEKGRWKYFREGCDNDKDEKWNEDGFGEVNFNKNFPFEYVYFEPDGGIYQLCEKETRALAEFIVEHPNVGIAVIFSSNSSLLKTPESGDDSGSRKPQTQIRKEDVRYYEYLGEQYREQIGIAKEADSPSVKGALADWIYFHRGRLALSTPVWSPEIALAMQSDKDEKKEEKKKENMPESSGKVDDASAELKEEQKSENSSDAVIQEATPDEGEKNGEKEKKKEEKRGQVEWDYLKWLEKNAPEYFLPWTPFEHPDFPGQKVEIGGFAPFAKTVPPAHLFNNLIDRHAAWLLGLADRLPRIEIQDVEIKDLGNGVFDVCAKIQNTGYLPTVLAHGERTREVLPTRVEISCAKEHILAGEANARIGSLKGSGGMEEVRWVLHETPGKTITIRVISALAGMAERSLELKGE